MPDQVPGDIGVSRRRSRSLRSEFSAPDSPHPTPLLYTTPNSSVMASRLAACEACRKAKVACDHKRPACSRCESNDRAGICIYRTTPFKRKRVEESPSSAQQSPRYAMETPVHLYIVYLYCSVVGYHRRNHHHATPQGQILIPTLGFW